MTRRRLAYALASVGDNLSAGRIAYDGWLVIAATVYLYYYGRNRITGKMMMRMLVRVMALLLAFAPLFAGSPRADERNPAPKKAKVFFLDLKDGQTIPAKITIHFGISGMELAAAGSSRPNTGHHHLLIDSELPPLDQPIPSDFNHIHFGRGQDEMELSLTPGAHTLQLLLGDGNHVPHDPPVVSPVIHVSVDPAMVQKTR